MVYMVDAAEGVLDEEETELDLSRVRPNWYGGP